METIAPTPSKTAFKWALISFVTSIVLTYLYQFLKLDVNSPVKYVNYIFFITFLILSQKEYREQLGGFVTFGQAFVEGLLFSVFSGIMIAIFTYIYFTILSPDVWEQAMTASQQKLEAAGNLSSEQIESAMGITRKYGVIIATVGVIIGTPILGAIISLIGAAIFKKERSILDIEQANTNFSDPVQ
ncbi:DUF4199 domain-containing protein [Mucilaginibacter sp. BJC16-A38]|uniref:DUF4199 domain-containing protein n=1 Tax=Mucilaginibacter phenanthrenivorans TaxID=1234842 RepID=UPI0021588F29|nr:DUF4199 domain-containing protein [Mucilaginibacter phenanthrenivorans]MCR8560513.1 DUF4199 domain-containing protein [Mucilaginibacter phenanthrenivorans]